MPASGQTLSSSQINANRAVVDGFLNELATRISQANLSSIANFGLYGAQSYEFGDLLDSSSWTPSQQIVIWLAAIQGGTCSEIENTFCSLPSIGGYYPAIWQYSQNPDYDLSIYDSGINLGVWPVVTSPC